MSLRIQTLPESIRRLRRRWLSLAARNQGVAAVEFALILPIMLTMYFGLVELSMAFGLDRKNGVIARTLGDLVTQSSSISNADFTSITNAATAILSPFPASEVTMRVTSFRIDGSGQVFVDWSSVRDFSRTSGSYSPHARCMRGESLVPSQLRIARTSIVISETTVKLNPVFNKFVGTYDLKDRSYFRPRTSNSVGREGVPTTACPSEVV